MTYPKFNYSVMVLIALCAVVLGSFNYVVDPYNKNRTFDLDLPKSQVSYRMHYPLYKALDYKYQPKGTLLLGDSRTNALNVKYFEQLGEMDVFNMAYGGGTVYEIIDSFWFAVEQYPLKRVYIGLPFNVYSEANKTNRFSEAKTLIDGSFPYYYSPFVAKTGIYNIASRIKGRSLKTEAPDMNKEQFWKSQLGDITSTSYGSWRASVTLEEKVKAMVEYSHKNNIEITFFIPPTHVELQNKVAEFGLEDEHSEFLSTLSGMAKLIDFDFANQLTRDKDRFKDPYHFTNAVGPFVVRVLLGLPVQLEEQDYFKVVEPVQ